MSDAGATSAEALRPGAGSSAGARGDAVWQRLRYARLLPLCGGTERAARAYAAAVAAVELRRDPHRARVAAERISRWLGAGPAAARRTFREALYSEAIEEADSLRFMRGVSSLREVAIDPSLRRGDRPRVYAALHFGSPMLAYLALRTRVEPELRVIARALDDANPMPAAKRAFAQRKVAWVETAGGARFLDTDGPAILHARERLLAGRPVYAAVDVPGDVVARAARMRIGAEAVLVAAGIFRLAAMAGADVRLVTSAHRRGRVEVRCRPAVAGRSAEELCDAVAAEVEAVVRAEPEEWWMWPYLVA